MGDNESLTVITLGAPSNLDQDFGYESDAGNRLTGTVWPDSNGDGTLLEAGGFGNVTIELLDQDGNLVQTTETDINGDFVFSNLPDGLYTVVVTDDNNVLNGFIHTDSPSGLSDTGDQTSKDDTGYVVDLDSAGVSTEPVSDVTSDFGYQAAVTNPISLGTFLAKSTAEGSVLVRWSTQTEVANIGFNLYGRVNDEWQKLNTEIVIGLGDSVAVQSYELLVTSSARVFSLSDIDLNGKETLHGPFLLEKSYGTIGERRSIDWQSENDEGADKDAKRQRARKQHQSEQLKLRQDNTRLKGESKL